MQHNFISQVQVPQRRCPCQFFARPPEGARRRFLAHAWSGLIALCLLWSLHPSAAGAQAAPRRLSVLNAAAAGVELEHVAAVDSALREALSQRPEFSAVETSPVPFEDVQLAAGCGSEESACLRLIGQQLGTDALLVRKLVQHSAGTATLSLVAQADVSDVSEASRQASADISWQEPGGAARVVRLLLARLQQNTPAVAPAAEESAPAATSPAEAEAAELANTSAPHAPLSRWRWRLGWTLTAVGAGLLVAGLTSGILSRHDERTYAHAAIGNEQDVDHAHALFERADQRAHLANALFDAGAAVTCLGIATTVWHLVVQRRDSAAASELRSPGHGRVSRPHADTTLAIQPTRAGAVLSLRGSWQGGT
jgi:hypothetical protein